MPMKQPTSSSVTPNGSIQLNGDNALHQLAHQKRLQRRILYWVIGGFTALFFVLVILWTLYSWLLPRPIQYGMVLQSPQKIADFSLMTNSGEPAKLSDFRGKYLLLNFGYTFCPDVCPITLASLTQTMQKLERKAEQTQVIFITVDPMRDSEERLDAYLSGFHPSFIGMTGTMDEVETVTTRLGIFFQKRDSEENTASDAYFVDHTATVAVIDPDGYMRLLFPYGLSGEEMAADLKILIQ